MKAIVNTAPGKVELQDLPLPEPGPDEVRIRTSACGICATDLEMIAGWARTAFPSIPGHEWAGVVDAVGKGVDPALVGRPCVAENVLADGGEVGFEHPGGYAQFFLTEADGVQVLPSGFPMARAVLIEPLAVCVRAMRRLSIEDPTGAVVFGDGPIGLLMLMLLQRAGVEKLVVVGGRDARLQLCRELGAHATVNYHAVAGDLAAAVRGAGPASFSNLIEASGSGAAMRAAFELAGRQGKVLVIGDYGEGHADFRWNDVLHRELTIVGSNASAEAWPGAVRLAVDGRLPLDRLLTHRLPASRFAEGLDLVRRKAGDVIKVVLEWQVALFPHWTRERAGVILQATDPRVVRGINEGRRGGGLVS